MRTFVALEINPEVQERIACFMEKTREQFSAAARWTRLESLHLTLKFIGEQPDDKLSAIKQALSTVRMQPFQIAFRGCGFFALGRRNGVLWAGVEAGPELTEAANKIENAILAVGIPKDRLAFNPHVTLAQNIAAEDFRRYAETTAPLLSPDFGIMRAHQFFLFQSERRKEGETCYRKIAVFESGK
jgi:2'-5' RNA ligase